MNKEIVDRFPAMEDVATAQNPVIDIRGLTISFGDNHVLTGYDFTLEKEESKIVMGRSGSGKTVLIKCMVGLLVPDSGVINIFGKNILEIKTREMDEVRKRIGFVFQGSALYDSLTIEENLKFPLRNYRKKLGDREINDRMHDILQNVGLPDVASKMPAELSGGMRKRIGLARALMQRPELILYDEPTSGLDPITSGEIIDLIMSIHKKYHASSVIITHDPKCARVAGEKIAILKDGKNYAYGSREELMALNDDTVNQFII